MRRAAGGDRLRAGGARPVPRAQRVEPESGLEGSDARRRLNALREGTARAPVPSRFMESNHLLAHANRGHEPGLLPLTRPRLVGGSTLSPEVGGEGSCGGRFMERETSPTF